MQTVIHSPERESLIRALFDQYITLYEARDERLTELFSDNFSGFAGSSNSLVKDRQTWQSITQQDFAQFPKGVRIETRDLSLQDISDDVVIATAFFHIYLPTPDPVFAKNVARVVMVFRLEEAQWKAVHVSAFVPHNLTQDDAICSLKTLQKRNQELEALVRERTQALDASEALYRLLTEDTQDVIWRTDRDLFITYISPSDERLRGFTADEVVGHHVFEMFTADGIACVKAVMQQRQQAFRDGSPSLSLGFEVQHRCKDGRLLWG